jgi:hypothetical protein
MKSEKKGSSENFHELDKEPNKKELFVSDGIIGRSLECIFFVSAYSGSGGQESPEWDLLSREIE